MKSPCKNICELDENDKCVGCGRTLEEIANWSKMSDKERKQVIERIKKEEDEY